jgi:hypothetical protein
VNFYVLDRKGNHAGTAIWSDSYYVVHDGRESRRLPSSYLLKRAPRPGA